MNLPKETIAKPAQVDPMTQENKICPGDLAVITVSCTLWSNSPRCGNGQTRLAPLTIAGRVTVCAVYHFPDDMAMSALVLDHTTGMMGWICHCHDRLSVVQ